MEDKRKFPRANKILPIKLSDAGYDILTETRNISASGAYCSVNKPLEPMTKLNVVLLIPVKKNKNKIIKKINCHGVVVRLEDDNDSNNDKYSYRIAIYFSGLKDTDRKVLHTCINSHLKES